MLEIAKKEAMATSDCAAGYLLSLARGVRLASAPPGLAAARYERERGVLFRGACQYRFSQQPRQKPPGFRWGAGACVGARYRPGRRPPWWGPRTPARSVNVRPAHRGSPRCRVAAESKALCGGGRCLLRARTVDSTFEDTDEMVFIDPS